MHIPDGFFDVKTAVTTFAVSVGFIAAAVAKTSRQLKDRQVPLMAVMAAFIFAAQMINFPIIGGTSGHLIGAVLAAILLGPWSATLIMTTILFIQWLIFQDGGFTALGGNILNMGVFAPFIGYYIYRAINLLGKNNIVKVLASFIAAWASVMVAAAAASFELAVSGTIAFKVSFPAMMFYHLFIGIGEGLITTMVIAFVTRVNSELIPGTVKA